MMKHNVEALIFLIQYHEAKMEWCGELIQGNRDEENREMWFNRRKVYEQLRNDAVDALTRFSTTVELPE